MDGHDSTSAAVSVSGRSFWVLGRFQAFQCTSGKEAGKRSRHNCRQNQMRHAKSGQISQAAKNGWGDEYRQTNANHDTGTCGVTCFARRTDREAEGERVERGNSET